MNKLQTLIYFSLLIFIFSCGNDTTEINENTDDTANPTVVIAEKPASTELIANIDYLRLRDSPGTSGETLAMFQKGEVLYDLGEVSDFTTAVELRGIKYNEPWLKVKTREGQEGWIYAGGVYFNSEEASDTMEKLYQKRLTSFYGEDVADDILDYQMSFRKARTDKDMQTVIRKGTEITNEVNDMNEKKMPMPRDMFGGKEQPDLRWLEEAFPGYILGSAAEGTILFLRRDLKSFARKAGKTRGKADDDFVNLAIKVHSTDSIEYDFPAYFMQTWDYGGHSLLGEGKHLDILTAANEMLAKHPGYLEVEIEQIKADLVHDMTASPQGYWYDKERILSELDKVLKAELGILTKEDMIALQEQRKKLENPVKSGVQVGLRSGIGDAG